MKEKRIWW